MLDGCNHLGNSAKKEKKLMAVEGDLAHKIIEIANRKGMTVYNFTNEILQQAIKAEGMNRSLEDVVERFRLLQIQRDSGAVYATADVLLYMVKELYKQKKEELLQKWYESGRWHGKYFKIKFNDEQPLDMVEKFLRSCSPDSCEIRMFRDGDKLLLNRVSPNDSMEYTELFSKFSEGIMHSFGYETKMNDVSKGLIALQFEKRKVSSATIIEDGR